MWEEQSEPGSWGPPPLPAGIPHPDFPSQATWTSPQMTRAGSGPGGEASCSVALCSSSPRSGCSVSHSRCPHTLTWAWRVSRPCCPTGMGPRSPATGWCGTHCTLTALPPASSSCEVRTGPGRSGVRAAGMGLRNAELVQCQVQRVAGSQVHFPVSEMNPTPWFGGSHSENFRVTKDKMGPE